MRLPIVIAFLLAAVPAEACIRNSFAFEFADKVQNELDYLVCLHNESVEIINGHAEMINDQAEKISELEGEVETLKSRLDDAESKIEDLERQ
ncbi:hypothetical protein [Rhizobium halophilum]|uniref:hypothetical protein n=1 Tax=Rhizobium halophilum TaxID=2846852 RepID=UPI001EFE919E|nr:hypothetical protein [Rhizobium halophilum]MCF6368330.1 hypothetical protein [Rhizobium halophilum]